MLVHFFCSYQVWKIGLDVVGGFGISLDGVAEKDPDLGSLVGKSAIRTQHTVSWVPLGYRPVIVGLSNGWLAHFEVNRSCATEPGGPQEGDEVRELCVRRHGESQRVFRPEGCPAAAALKTWTRRVPLLLVMFPFISVQSTHRRVSSTHMSYCYWMCLYWLRLKLDESASAWKAVLPNCCRAHAVFILSCCVIAPVSRPSARWNGFLSRAFFLAGTHFSTSQEKNGLRQNGGLESNYPGFGTWAVMMPVSPSCVRPDAMETTSWETTRRCKARRGRRGCGWRMRGLRDARQWFSNMSHIISIVVSDVVAIIRTMTIGILIASRVSETKGWKEVPRTELKTA